ncbi:50S ribosomal protein L1 [Patescibacteria group bacterium]|nr:50S ribosomal protein L1 [Patescibacteria group bacterium]
MGRPRIKIIDDSLTEPEIKKKKKKDKSSDKAKYVKVEKASQESELESVKTNGEVGQTTKVDKSNEEQDVKQASEDHAEDTSSTLQSSKPSQEKTQKPGTAKSKSKSQAKLRGKKYQEAIKNLDKSKLYPLEEAIDMVKKMSYSKINATLEAHINTTQMGIRGLVSLPYARGVQLRILVFGPSTPQLEGVIFGTDSTIEEINKGKIDFDLVIATPDWMPKLAKVARILGPRNLMPNPKNSTIVTQTTEAINKAVKEFQAGKTEYKTESKAPIVHIAMGKIDQPTEELSANIKTLMQVLGKTKIKKITLSSTMGPGIKIDLTSF